MSNQRLIEQLVENLADRSRRNRRSAVVFCLVAALIEIAIVAALRQYAPNAAFIEKAV